MLQTDNPTRCQVSKHAGMAWHHAERHTPCMSDGNRHTWYGHGAAACSAVAHPNGHVCPRVCDHTRPWLLHGKPFTNRCPHQHVHVHADRISTHFRPAIEVIRSTGTSSCCDTQQSSQMIAASVCNTSVPFAASFSCRQFKQSRSHILLPHFYSC